MDRLKIGNKLPTCSFSPVQIKKSPPPLVLMRSQVCQTGKQTSSAQDESCVSGSSVVHFTVISWQKSTVTVGLHNSSLDTRTTGPSEFCSFRPNTSWTFRLLSSSSEFSPTMPDLGFTGSWSEESEVRSMVAEAGGVWLVWTSLHTCCERNERFCQSSDMQTCSWFLSLSSFSFSDTCIQKTHNWVKSQSQNKETNWVQLQQRSL